MRASGRAFEWASCLAGALVPVLVLVAGTESRSQGMVIVREAAAVQPPAEEDAEVEEDAPQQAAVGGFVMNDDQFEMWVFGGNGPMNSGAARRNRLESLLTPR